jgi:hypothetical protein
MFGTASSYISNSLIQALPRHLVVELTPVFFLKRGEMSFRRVKVVSVSERKIGLLLLPQWCSGQYPREAWLTHLTQRSVSCTAYVLGAPLSAYGCAVSLRVL